MEHVADDTYRRTITVDGDPGVIEITRGGGDHLVLRAHLPHAGGLIHVVQRARAIFGLDRDPSAADAHLADDPVLAPLIAASPGLRVPGTWDPFETGVRAIVGQQVSVAGASTVTARIVERVGVPVPGLEPFGLTHTFPAPATLATADLDGIGMPGARAEAIKAFAAAVDKGELPLDGRLPLDDLLAADLRRPRSRPVDRRRHRPAHGRARHVPSGRSRPPARGQPGGRAPLDGRARGARRGLAPAPSRGRPPPLARRARRLTPRPFVGRSFARCA